MRRIASELKEDHDRLRELLLASASPAEPLRVRKKEFARLSTAWKATAKAKRKTIYPWALTKKNLKTLALETSIESETVDFLLKKVKHAQTGEIWRAGVKVLSDFLTLHLNTEDALLLPMVDEILDSKERRALLRNYRSFSQVSRAYALPAKVINLPITPRNENRPPDSLRPRNL